ncbi:MAG: glycosyl hydrolase family 65 protein, partial [Verrucomicrobiota bacterium]
GTGTAGWFYVVMLNHVYGLRPTVTGLRVDPCLPPEWKRCAVIRQFRGAQYRVSFDQTRGYEKVAELILNGQNIEPTQVLPHQPGQYYEVQVVMH